MNPELIALVLALPLPVRLALLDADPNAPGWYVGIWFDGHHAWSLSKPHSRTRSKVGHGAAWLPCNPLAIVEHAARERGLDCAPTMRRTSSGWRFALVVEGQHGQDVEVESASGPCHHTAAVALLREVVGG